MTSIKRPEAESQPSRRRFAKSVAAAFVAAPLASAFVAAQQPPAPKEAAAPPNPAPTPTPAPPTPSPVAEAYAEVARARFGEQTTPAEFAKIKRDLESYVRTTERLRAFKLKNGDEPDFVFSAD